MRVVQRCVNHGHPSNHRDGQQQDSLHAQQPMRNRPSASGLRAVSKTAVSAEGSPGLILLTDLLILQP